MSKTCVQYHNETSYERHNMGGHFLDWTNQPEVYKVYPGIEPVALRQDVSLQETAFSSVVNQVSIAEQSQELDLESLSRILLLTNTFTARARYQGGEFYYRSAASAGALYPTEIYAATHSVGGIQDGLYHFAIHLHGLIPLRRQDLSSHLAHMTTVREDKAPTLTLFLTSIFFRSAWKYRARSYRYHLLDTGHVAENLVLALKSLKLPFDLTYDFDDKEVNHLLGLDESKEATLAVVRVYGSESSQGKRGERLPGLPQEIISTSRVSQNEVDYPLIREMHGAGNRIKPWDGGRLQMSRNLGITVEGWSRVEDPIARPEIMKYPESVFRRRSKRNFVRKPIRKPCMEALLSALCRPDPAENSSESMEWDPLAVGYLAAHVESMEPGFYLLDTATQCIGRASSGMLTKPMTSVCLDQEWLAYAGVHFLFIANLEVLDQAYGPRGYRYALLTAGRLGQRLYVAAEAMGLGCCGIGALYDGEAAGLLGLNPASRLLYLVAVGTVKKTPNTVPFTMHSE